MKMATSVAVIGGIVASAVSAQAALNLPTQSCAFTFNTNMKLGSRGTDVMNLQKVLNMYPQTRVAESGAGSPGMETTYFGAGTRAAANKFQALHLVELGISAPTGNVFGGTRGLLNQVCNGSVSTTPGNTVSGPVSAMLAASQPTGMVINSQSGARLADITLSGNGSVTAMQLQRIGASSDTDLVNVYLYDGNTRITDAASVSTGGFINFNLNSNPIMVNGSRTITVRADLSSSVSGRSVGVKLNSMTAGGAVSTFTNVIGNMLQGSSVTAATVNFSTVTVANTSVDAGTNAYNVWSGSATVNTRNVSLRAATFKFVGSAPVDAMQNINLFVDGTKIAGPVMVNATNNNKVVFDLGSTPYNLTTGSHTIDVRADIVKGSNRTISMSVESVADLMFEDSNLTGVNVAATVNNATLTQSNSTYRTITVNKGSVTTNVDPSFNPTKVTGGATNVPVGQFTLKAYGEDVKVNTLQVTPSLTSAAPYANGLANVTLYVNGGQVGTTQNWTSGNLSFGSNNLFTVPAGQTVTLTVKADIVNATSSAAYTAGTVAVTIGGVANNAQGINSNELVDAANPSVAGNSLTVSTGAGTFASTAGFVATYTAPNVSGVKIGSYTLQAGAAEAIKVNSVGISPVVATMAQTNVSNLTLKTGSTVLGTPVGNPAAGTSTFSFSDIIVPANGTITFDVYADLGSATSGSVTTAATISYRGAVSNTTTTSQAGGVAITAQSATLAASTLSAQSPVAQFVVGGSTFGIATFTLKTTSAGMNANVRELRFSTTGTNAIESITVGGVTASVVNGSSTVTGLNIAVSSTGTDVPVTVKLAGYQNTTSGGTLSTTVGNTSISLSYVEATSGSGTVISSPTIVSSNTMSHVASKPTVSVGAGNTDSLVLGAENKVGEFTVTADANGKIAVATTSLSLSSVGITNPAYTAIRIADGNTTISTAVWDTSSTTPVFTFTPSYEIGAGLSKTFSVYATVNGAAQASITPYVTSRLTSAASFTWKDVMGGSGSNLTGTNILNFPTSSFTTKR